jgi:prepilin-type N-terminal cleavage/methylation domain-containing protein
MRQQQGFSLIELVVTLAILTLVMGAAFTLMARSQQSFDANQLLAEAHQNADFAVTRITELIRAAGSNPRSTTTVNWTNFLSYPDASNIGEIRIMSDLDGDGAFDDHVEGAGAKYFLLNDEDVTISYNDADDTIEMVSNVPGGLSDPVVIAEHILNFEVELYQDYQGVTNFRQVQVRITAGPSRAVNASDPRYRTFTTAADIRLRNR